MTAPNDYCLQIESLLDAYYDGELSEPERSPVQQHVHSCLNCQAKLGEIGRVVSSLRNMPRVMPAKDFDIDDLLSRRAKKKSVVVRPLIWGSLSVAAAAALLLVSLRGGFWSAPTNPVVSHQPGSKIEPGKDSTRNSATTIAREPSSQVEPINSQAPVKGPAGEQKLAAQPALPNSLPASQVDINQPPQPKQLVADKPRKDAPPPASKAMPLRQQDAVAYQTNEPITGYVALDASEDEEAVAIALGDQRTITESIGIATDEDGLYALKM